MQTVLRNVKDISGDDRQSLEHVVGAPLQDDQQVLIHVLNVGVVPTEDARREGIQRAAIIAERGRQHAATLGVTCQEADEAIEQANREVRQRRSS
jgi:hypothetical protein